MLRFDLVASQKLYQSDYITRWPEISTRPQHDTTLCDFPQVQAILPHLPIATQCWQWMQRNIIFPESTEQNLHLMINFPKILEEKAFKNLPMQGRANSEVSEYFTFLLRLDEVKTFFIQICDNSSHLLQIIFDHSTWLWLQVWKFPWALKTDQKLLWKTIRPSGLPNTQAGDVRLPWSIQAKGGNVIMQIWQNYYIAADQICKWIPPLLPKCVEGRDHTPCPPSYPGMRWSWSVPFPS